MGNIINEFRGDYEFLSNFYPSDLDFGWITFPTAEHAFQAIKSIDPEDWKAIASCSTPGQAKRMGQKLKLRVGWDWLKLQFMEEILEVKFTQHPELMKQLRLTGDALLVEGNNWGDTYWGQCKGFGYNHLGKLLMKIRGNHYE